MKSLLLASLVIFSSSVYADQTAEIDIEANFEPTQAVGLVISSSGTAQKSNVTWTRASETILTVKVPVTSAEQKKDAFVTAMIVGGEGDVAFGPMKSSALQESLDSIFSLPECPKKEISPGLESQSGQLQLLVEIRALRRETYQKKLNSRLSGDLLTRVRTLEHGFGLSHPTQIGPDLHPLELGDRLSRLADAVRNHQTHKAASAPTAPPAPKND